MKKSCYSIDNNHFRITGYNDKMLGICCEVFEHVETPRSELGITTEDSFKNWENLITQVRAESDFELCDRIVSKACFQCPKYVPTYEVSDKIKVVNIAMYPSPCQSACIYCSLRADGCFDMINKEKVDELYQRLIGLCNYLKENDKLDDEVEFHISSGEIAIHPYKEQILDIVGNSTADFYSNGMKFDEGVAKNLNKNPKSRVIVSLDCGTSETWNAIKRRNNFYKTLDNLAKYREYTTRKEQIELKYIVLPGINTSDEDFDGIVEIMKKLDVPKIFISRNFYEASENRPELIKVLTPLVQKLIKNNLEWTGEFALSAEELSSLETLEQKHEVEHAPEQNCETLSIYKINQAFIGETGFSGYTTIELEALGDEVLIQTVTRNFDIDYYLRVFKITLDEAIKSWVLTKVKIPAGTTLEIDTTDTHIIITTRLNYKDMLHSDLLALGAELNPNENYVSLNSIIDNIVNIKSGFLHQHSQVFNGTTFEQEFEVIKSQVTELSNQRTFDVFEKIKSSIENNKEVILFGLDNNNMQVVNTFVEKGLVFHGVCDLRMEQQICPITGMKIISLHDLSKYYSEALILISSDTIDISCLNQLGFIEEQIIHFQDFASPPLFPLNDFITAFYDGYKYAYENLKDDESRRVLLGVIRRILLGERISKSSDDLQYFVKDVVALENGEIFVDGGAFDGDTVCDFIGIYKRQNVFYKQIYSFEPDITIFEQLTNELIEFPNIQCINKGLWSENTDLVFHTTKYGLTSAFFKRGDETITVPVVTLDSFFENKPESEWPTFIKLDVEGAEQQTLHGARRIITTKRPKLAICTYHRYDDIYELIKFLTKCNPNYEFKLRQHGDDYYEQVLYCIDKTK